MGARRSVRGSWGAAALLGVLVLAGCSGSDDASPPTTTTTAPRSGTVSFVLEAKGPQKVLDREQVRVSVPVGWEVDARSHGAVVLRTGTPACHYQVSVSAVVEVSDDPSAVAALAALLPKDDRTFESGKRGSASWRVTRRAASDQVRVDGARVQPLRSLSQRTGRYAWLATKVEAASEPGDECHAGTWRDVLGPAIGDLLATARRLP